MAAAKHVRVIHEYTYIVDDVDKRLRQGDECVVLCEYDRHWLYVCKVGSIHHMYVPRQFVEPVSSQADSERDASSMAGPSHDEAHQQLYATMSRCPPANDATRSAGDVRRAPAAATSNVGVANGVEHVTTCGSVIGEASYDSDDDDDKNVDDDDDNDSKSDYVLFTPCTEQPPSRPAVESELDNCNTALCRPRRLHSVGAVLHSTKQPSADKLQASKLALGYLPRRPTN